MFIEILKIIQLIIQAVLRNCKMWDKAKKTPYSVLRDLSTNEKWQIERFSKSSQWLFSFLCSLGGNYEHSYEAKWVRIDTKSNLENGE